MRMYLVMHIIYIKQRYLLNQAHASCRPEHTWFLEIALVYALVRVYVRVCLCLYVRPQGH